jgi:sigma-B regulation protein RsbU (phosphoserine phosphatase)
MSLSLERKQNTPGVVTVHLGGRLDAQTAPELDRFAEAAIVELADHGTLVLDLTMLEYMSSAGLRSCAKLRRALAAHNGRLLVVNPQAQVARVFEIVKAVPVNEIFASVAELDAYLDTIQRKVRDDNE